MEPYTDDHKYAHVRIKWEIVWETHLCKKKAIVFKLLASNCTSDPVSIGNSLLGKSAHLRVRNIINFTSVAAKELNS